MEGILSHSAVATEDGWFVVDVWESEEALQRFIEVIGPVLQEIRYAGEPRIVRTHNFVNR